MSDLFERLAGETVTLVCFGEFVGFVHLGEKGHCRFETPTVVVNSQGDNMALFPEPAYGAISSILGLKIQSIDIDSEIRISLDDGFLVSAPILSGYESVMISVGDEFEIY